jgi:hypothetical protein
MGPTAHACPARITSASHFEGRIHPSHLLTALQKALCSSTSLLPNRSWLIHSHMGDSVSSDSFGDSINLVCLTFSLDRRDGRLQITRALGHVTSFRNLLGIPARIPGFVSESCVKFRLLLRHPKQEPVSNDTLVNH